jgi:hypothetical protein
LTLLTQKPEAETSKRVAVFSFALWIGTKRVDYRKIITESDMNNLNIS